MSGFIFPTKDTPILCQGITSEMGAVHTERAIAYGSRIVAGTSRDKRISHFLDIPVYQTVKAAVRRHKPQISVIFATPRRALSDVEEAIKAHIPLIICTAEHVPLHDVLKMRALAQKHHVILIGPSSPGIVVVDHLLAGNAPAHLFSKGCVGIIGRSSSLVYEAVQQLRQAGLGVSTGVCLGAAPLVGTSFLPFLEAFINDKQTKAILVVGQIHGALEKELAEAYAKIRRKKPLIVYIPGSSLMTADTIPLMGTKTLIPAEIIKEKQTLLKKAKAILVPTPDLMGQTVADCLASKGKKK